MRRLAMRRAAGAWYNVASSRSKFIEHCTLPESPEMMKRTLFLCVCAATLAAACSTTPKADDADVTGSRSAGLIDVHEVVVSSPRGDGGFFTISEGGEVEVVDEGAPLAPGHYTTIAPDGAVTLADGSPFFTLNADGTLIAADGSLIPITIAEDGTTKNAKMSKPLVFDDAGSLSEEGIAESAAVAHVGGEDGAARSRS